MGAEICRTGTNRKFTVIAERIAGISGYREKKAVAGAFVSQEIPAVGPVVPVAFLKEGGKAWN